MNDQPTTGRCELCNQTRPVFPLPFRDGTQAETADLCSRCHSTASQMTHGQLAEALFVAIGGA